MDEDWDSDKSADSSEWVLNQNQLVCQRDTWKNRNRCIWNAEVGNKPSGELQTARADGPERLYGVYLSQVTFGSDVTFADCQLTEANLNAANLTYVDLSGADIWRANIREADLSAANLSGAYVIEGNLNISICSCLY